MKKLKKILIILSLSMFLTAIITPEKEKEAEGSVIVTAAVAIGSLAVAALGGYVAYNSRHVINEVGQRAVQKLEETGTNVSEMLAQNQFGINKKLTDAIADSMEEMVIAYGNNTVNTYKTVLTPGTTHTFDIDSSFWQSGNNHYIYINHSPIDTSDLFIGVGKISTFLVGVGPGSRGPGSMTYISPVLTRYNLSTKSAPYYFIDDMKAQSTIYFSLRSTAMETTEISVDIVRYKTEYELGMAEGIRGIPSISDGTAVNYSEIAANNLSGSESIAIDYDRLAAIMEGTSNDSISMTNINELVTSLEGTIEEGNEATVGILTTIWNGIKNIPNIIQQTATNTIAAINGIPDALAGLWDDLGAIWTGFGETLANVNTNIKEFGQSIPNAISNGIDNIRDFNADMLERLSTGIDNIRAVGTTIITTITETGVKIGEKIGTIGSDIITGLVNIVVPSESDMDRVRENTEQMKSTFSQKLEFITVPIKSISGLFLEPKSLYDVTFKMQGVEVHVLPESFRSSVNILKPVLNGVIVLLTFIGIYRKIHGKEVI